MNQAVPYFPNPAMTNARVMLSLMLVAAVCLFADAMVATRGLDIGSDTRVYAAVFAAFRHGSLETRFEPGFLLITIALAKLGISLAAYQGVLFLIMIGTVIVATRRYHGYLESHGPYLTFLIASLMLLFLSPVFMNATINAVRQGLASLLVFTALLAFHQRRWRDFILYGVLASSFHYSSLLYLLFAPALLLSPRTLRLLALVAFLAYCSGLTMLAIRAAVPALYTAVMAYDAAEISRTGVRIDFAVFSIFWYALPYVVSRLVQKPAREQINHSTAVYLVMLLPFFAVGWGSFSNRYLLPAWLAASLIVAAILCNSRVSLLRSPLLLRAGLCASCGVLYFYVTHGIVL